MAAGFGYPELAHRRRHGPQGYADYHSYRPWLRDEFRFCCVYCLIREQWGRVSGEFNLDHYQPQRLHRDRANEYDNLLYSCATCNLAKGDHVIPDPTVELTALSVIVHDDGSIEGLTEDVDRLIRVLDLDDEDYRRWRRTWIRIIELAARYDPDLYRQLLRFPDDLPDLSRLRPPAGNERPEGIEHSYFAMRQRGELPATYGFGA
jgi:hypothetical protein